MNATIPIYPIQPSGNSWMPKGWNGNASRVGSTKPRNPSAVRGKKGSIIVAYLTRLPHTRIICVDEKGSIAVKTYPGEE
jgi:hypothetical protein